MFFFTSGVRFLGKLFAEFEGDMGGATLSLQSIDLQENSIENRELIYQCVDYVSKDYFASFKQKPLLAWSVYCDFG